MPAQQFDSISTQAVIGMFFQQMAVYQGRAWVDRLANRFHSNSTSELYAGLGTVPQLREWLGGKKAKSFIEQSIRITNKDFEATLGVQRRDLRRDKTGYLQMRIGQLVERALAHDAKLLSDLIENGAGTTLASCYDGKALFANDHSTGSSGAIDNLIDSDISDTPTATHGTTTDPSPGDFAHAVMNAVRTLATFKDDQGEPINEFINKVVVMVPTGLSKAANLALAQPTIAGNEANPLLNNASGITYQLVVNARLTWTAKFAVFRVDSPSLPFILQTEVAPMLEVLAEGSDHSFKENEHLFSVIKSGNVGLGAYDQAVQVTFVA